MDPLTQGLLGAAVGHAVAGRKLGRAAIFVGFLGGQSPDLDVLMVSDDSSIDYWRYHRGITHSLFFAPVVFCFRFSGRNHIMREQDAEQKR